MKADLNALRSAATRNLPALQPPTLPVSAKKKRHRSPSPLSSSSLSSSSSELDSGLSESAKRKKRKKRKKAKKERREAKEARRAVISLDKASAAQEKLALRQLEAEDRQSTG